MFRELHIKGFRAFQRFHMEGLGRINLLVGTNNCGKTSVLEAVHLLAARDPSPLRLMHARRGERLSPANGQLGWWDIRHLFHGRQLDTNSLFEVTGSTGASQETLRVDVLSNHPALGKLAVSLGPEEDEGAGGELLALRLGWAGTAPLIPWVLTLSPRGGLSLDSTVRAQRRGQPEPPSVRFISTAALDAAEVIRLFDEIVLTPEENALLEALRTIEPSIERLASTREGELGERGGLKVKCTDVKQPIPIGSMGDGIWRILGLALALISARDGVLLVDEIDTGLHYSVMADMWTLVSQTAQRLNVQVFATTHSRDCYESLATISHADVTESSEVSIQRIERAQERAVRFSEREIIIAAKRGIEVR